MFDPLPETHAEFRFLSRTTRDVITGVMLLLSLVGMALLVAIFVRILWLMA